MPWLTIICFVASSVVGLVFNFDFKLIRFTDDKAGIGLNWPEAQADTATTSVTVLNAPPNWTFSPAESPISTSTAPVNEGATLSFTGTATDPETNDYFLLVCATDAATPVNGGPPSCVGNQFCVSATTTSGNAAVCDYENVTNAAEVVAWYAFVCDAHATEADCSSPGNQGSLGDGSESPFYVNHDPAFSEVNTTVDNQAPDALFTVTASTTDNDAQGGNDIQYLYVCGTDSWATSTGCAVPFCYGTSTAPADPSCQFASSTPARDGTYTYYAFVMDWHYLGSSDNSNTDTYTIINVAPVVGTITLQNGNDIRLALKEAPEAEASSTITISDNNGCPDIVSATGSIYWESATDQHYCAYDRDDCYQIAATDCSVVAGSCTGWNDVDVEYTCATSVAFHAQPTDGNSNFPATRWYAGATGWDEALSDVGTSSSGVELVTNTALEVTEDDIAYGSIRGGQNSGARNATTTIVNFGNSPIDSDIDGEDMDRDGGGDLIEVYNQKYGLLTFTWPNSQYTLFSTTTQTVDIVAPKPTNSSIDIDDEIYWGIAIPPGKLSGDYYGTNTIAVALDGDGW